MKDLFNQLLDEMRIKVVANLETVKRFENEIKEKSNSTSNISQNFQLEYKRKASRKLLTDNLDYLELQLKLIQFIDKYRSHDIITQPVPPGMMPVDPTIDYFIETIEGRIQFNKFHPLYSNESFINRLMDYYLAKEDYKNCELVAQARQMINRISSL